MLFLFKQGLIFTNNYGCITWNQISSGIRSESSVTCFKLFRVISCSIEAICDFPFLFFSFDGVLSLHGFFEHFWGFPFITFHVAYMASQKRLNLNVHKSFWNLEELFSQFIYENLLSNFAVLGDKIRRRLKRATQCFGEVFYYLDGGLIFSIFLQQLWRKFDLGK